MLNGAAPRVPLIFAEPSGLRKMAVLITVNRRGRQFSAALTGTLHTKYLIFL
jgi:hypothetical protein